MRSTEFTNILNYETCIPGLLLYSYLTILLTKFTIHSYETLLLLTGKLY
jgi:hypothetical protein